MAIEKIKNKIHGYHCDKCRVVPKVIFSDSNGFLCELHAVEKFGKDAVDAAVLEE